MASMDMKAVFEETAVDGVLVAPGVAGLLALTKGLDLPGITSEGIEAYLATKEKSASSDFNELDFLHWLGILAATEMMIK